MSGTVTRTQVEDFLFEEAELLDQWKLREWLALFTKDAQYQVPAAGLPQGASPESSLFYIADDRFRLGQRIERLSKKSGHCEWPRSKTRHFFSNVRLLGQTAESVDISLNFICYRTKDDKTDVYWGQSNYSLVRDSAQFLIKAKRCVLDLDGLAIQGRVSILL